VCANDLEQAVSRVFARCCKIVAASPLFRNEVKITNDRIVFTATGATITALASDAASAAGAHPTISVFDEAWGITTERGRRLFDELVPVPTRPFSVRLVVSHAGFTGQSELLYELYQLGLEQQEVAPCLYSGAGQLMYWTHSAISPDQNEGWIADMRRKLRPNQFARMIENKFVSGESSFIDPLLWDACVDPNLGRTITDRSLAVFAAVDASTKHDSTALVLGTWVPSHQRFMLCDHRIFTPSSDRPIDFTTDVEQILTDWHRRFNLKSVMYDPHQMTASAQRLQRQGLRMQEFPQTMSNLTTMGENLFALIKGRNLLVYPDEQIRTAVLHAVAVESGRGWRLDKSKQSDHVDIVISLAMAALAAVRAQGASTFDVWDWVGGRDPPGLSAEEKAAAEAKRNVAWQNQQLVRYMMATAGGGDARDIFGFRTFQWR
jgi:hypothetical protein